jgi:hypothetical protein
MKKWKGTQNHERNTRKQQNPTIQAKQSLPKQFILKKDQTQKLKKGIKCGTHTLGFLSFFYLQSLQHIRGWGVCNWKIMSVGEIAGN